MGAWRVELVFVAVAFLVAQRSLASWAPRPIAERFGSKRTTQILVALVVTTEGVVLSMSPHQDSFGLWVAGVVFGMGATYFLASLIPKSFWSEESR